VESRGRPARVRRWAAARSRALGPRALPGVVPILFVAVAILAIAGATVAMVLRRDGLGFLLTMSSIVVVVGAAFSALFPRVMVSSTSASDSLTLWNAASAHETLFVMTVVAAVFTPVVLAYQGFSYWVLRKRLSRPPQQRGPSVAGAETR
jgi:cytochrome d ubiquinol oxidase subunit II